MRSISSSSLSLSKEKAPILLRSSVKEAHRVPPRQLLA